MFQCEYVVKLSQQLDEIDDIKCLYIVENGKRLNGKKTVRSSIVSICKTLRVYSIKLADNMYQLAGSGKHLILERFVKIFSM